MWLRRMAAPLITGTTYRRAVFLLLGGLVLPPYLLLGVVLARLLRDADVPLAGVLPLIAASVALAVVPPFLGGCRALEIAVARSLLDAELSEPVPRGRIDRETRLRAALWISVHVVIGGLVALSLVSVVPMALMLVAFQFGLRVSALPGRPFGPLEAHHGVVPALVGVLALVVLGYCLAGLGALARSMAPTLLGPSQSERIAALEARAERLAERERLARELHDSIGHALTVTTLQAAAARELLDADPGFAREALRRIEETGRGAMDELDYALGLLHARDPAEPRVSADRKEPVARRTLADLVRLVTETRAAGVPVGVEVNGPVEQLPLAVSREGYRIVQEGLTNAARHAGGAEVTLRVSALDAALDIDLVNAAGTETGPSGGQGDGRSGGRGGGRGLAGMRERVRTLGGSMSAGRDEDVWRVNVRLPAPRGGDA